MQKEERIPFGILSFYLRIWDSKEEPDLMQPSYYTKKLYKFIHTVITNGFQMIIVTFKVHPFDKNREEWYSNIVISCRNPYYFLHYVRI